MEPRRYDLIVIGSGPAGEKGAATAASFGKRVAMIEKAPYLGGNSANTGTLPSKTLRETALVLSGLRTRDLYGVDLSLRREATIADLMYHERHVKANERERVRRNLAVHEIDLVRGTGRFVDPHTIEVVAEDGGATTLLEGEVILIATGSSPVRPDGFDFDDPRIYDSDEILQMERLPKTLAVIGAGTIGSEYACTFAALGTDVCIIDGRHELMPFLDRDVSGALERSMAEHLRITFVWGERVTACEAAPGSGPVTLTTDHGRELMVDAVLVAAGRTSNTGALNLPAAGLEADPKGRIPVDGGYRTKVPHIFAAGDVIGSPALAATSMEQARAAMCNAFNLGIKCPIAPLLPTGIYTIPEVSMVGDAEEDLAAKGVDFVVGRAYYAQNARGQIIGEPYGFLKLIFRKDDMKLLGVHVIGENASEIVHAGMIAMLAGGDADLLNRACFNYPTLGDLYQDATYDALLKRAGVRGTQEDTITTIGATPPPGII
jgi:NAD(P) transhydrogenase